MEEMPTRREDEIELIDYLRVIWKWKYLLLVGTLVCALLAGVISLNRPKIYRIDMALEPGVVRMNEFGNRIQIASGVNMKALIEERTFENALKDYLKSLKLKSGPGPLTLSVTSPRSSDIIKISYETASVEKGIIILNQIPKLLLKAYADFVRMNENYFKEKIRTESEKLLDLNNERSIAISDIEFLQKRIKELDLEINELQNSHNLLKKNRNDLVADQDAANVNMDLLYSNVIQENLRTINEYKHQVLNLLSEEKKAEFQLKRIEEKIDVKTEEIMALKKEKDSVQYIQVIQPPTSNTHPIRPRILKNVMLTTGAGLLIMLFVTFLLEYILRHKSMTK